jgi:hypothetical protein
MTSENRETMQRAIGIIEGASYMVKQAVQEALMLAVEILDEVLKGESNELQG